MEFPDGLEENGGSEYMDARETLYGGVEIGLHLPPESLDVIIEPTNIIFIGLPKYYDGDDLRLKSDQPYIRGFKPGLAQLILFNPVTLSKAQALIKWNQNSMLWNMPGEKPLTYKKSSTTDVLWGSNDSEDDELRNKLEELGFSELLKRFAESIGLHFMLVKALESDEESANRFIDLLDEIQRSLQKEPDDDANEKLNRWLFEMKDLFHKNMPELRAYRYGRLMMVDEVKVLEEGGVARLTLI